MKCKEWEELFSDYIEGNLNLVVKEEVEAHLKGCSRCNHRVEQMRTLMGRLHDLEMVEPSPGFEAKFWSRLRRESLKRSYHQILSPIPALAALLILVATGYLLFSSPSPRKSHLISEADIVNVQPSGGQAIGGETRWGYRTGESGVSLERFQSPADTLSKGRTRYVLPVISNRPKVEFTSF